MPERKSRLARTTGLALAATGLSHFVVPQVYEGMTKAAFPTNTRRHVAIDGGIETVLGLGLAGRRTRTPATVGLLAYLAYLASNVVRKR